MIVRSLLASLVVVALTLSAGSPSASADDAKERALCLELTDYALRANAQAGKWIDRVTRHDGMVVACEDKKIELKRFMRVALETDRDAWRERQEVEFRQASCSNTLARRAMEEGWEVLATYTMATGRSISLSAECD